MRVGDFDYGSKEEAFKVRVLVGGSGIWVKGLDKYFAVWEGFPISNCINVYVVEGGGRMRVVDDGEGSSGIFCQGRSRGWAVVKVVVSWGASSFFGFNNSVHYRFRLGYEGLVDIKDCGGVHRGSGGVYARGGGYGFILEVHQQVSVNLAQGAVWGWGDRKDVYGFFEEGGQWNW